MVSGSGLGFFDNNVLPSDLHHVPADVDGLLSEINVLPFQPTALAPAHPRGDDELEIRLIPSFSVAITFAFPENKMAQKWRTPRR